MKKAAVADLPAARVHFMITGSGYGNYAPAFASVSVRGWHGVTAQSNFTWSNALGSGFPLEVNVGGSRNVDCQSFGEMACSEGSTNEGAPFYAPYTGGNSAHKNLVLT